VIARYGDGWKLRVVAAPERGKANDEVLGVIADAVGVPRSAVRLVAGAASRDKIVEIGGLGAAEADRRLEQAARPRVPANPGRSSAS
jgi:uncharacterized protein